MKKRSVLERFFIIFLLLAAAFADFSAGDDEVVGVLLRRTGLLTFAGRFAPCRLRAAQTATLTAFTAAVWVVDRVHRCTTDGRADTFPA